jgi:hypothetical protein
MGAYYSDHEPHAGAVLWQAGTTGTHTTLEDLPCVKANTADTAKHAP